MDRGQQAVLDRLVAIADDGFEGRDHVADDVFRRVVQQQREPRGAVEARGLGARDGFHQQRVLRHRKDVRALGLSVPARNTCETVSDVFQFNIER